MLYAEVYHFPHSFQNHRRIYQDGVRVLMEMHSAWISGNDHKLNREGSDLTQIKYFSAGEWSTGKSSSKTLCNLDPWRFLIKCWTYFEQEVGLEVSWGSFQPKISYDFINLAEKVILINPNLSCSGNKPIQPKASHLKLVSCAPMTLTWSITRNIVMNLLVGDSKAGDSM